MYICSECGLYVGAEDETVVNEPSRPCRSCRQLRAHDDFDADELGLDPEEDYD